MKTYILSFVLLVALQASLFAQTNVTLTINHKLGNDQFAMNAQAQNSLGNAFEVTRLEYYMSQITLTHDGGQETTASGVYALVNAAQSTVIDLGDLNVTNLEKVSFYVGVDFENNHKDPSLWPSEHPLAPKLPSMHWGWASGYRFIAYEGNSGTNMSQNFQLHGLGNDNYFKTEIDLTAAADNGSLGIFLDADYSRGLEGIDLSSGVIVHGENAEARDALVNFQQHVFSPGSPSTSIDTDLQLSNFDLYPNPSTDGSIKVKIQQEQAANLELIVTDLSGRQISSQNLSGTSIETAINLSQSGLYFVSLMKDGQRIAVKKAILN